MLPRPPTSTLFPYTTLFRSVLIKCYGTGIFPNRCFHRSAHRRDSRSEEHTSELQSRFDLVCRLLLEKKKKKPHQNQDQAHTDQALTAHLQLTLNYNHLNLDL